MLNVCLHRSLQTLNFSNRIATKMTALNNINDLPREILTKVFRYLDVRNLKNATVTCKLWNQLIESECQWSIHFIQRHGKLVIKGRFFVKQFETNRRFGKIRIERANLTEENLKMIQRLGFNVSKLILEECRIGNLAAFADLLNCCPNLKHAVLELKMLHGDALLDQVLPNLKTLKILEMTRCDERIVECFRKAKLTTMVIRQMNELSGPLVEFLSCQESLTSLTVHSSASILVDMGEMNVRFPLMELTISELGIEMSSPDQEKLLKFVKSNAEDLTEFELGSHIPDIHECIFINMAKLNRLSVNVDQIPRDNSIYKRWKANCSVREIRLMGYVPKDTEFIVRFMKLLPNIRSVILCKIYGANILAPIMAEHLTKIDSISIDSIYGSMDESLNTVAFPNLKTLRIQNVLAGKINWKEFTKVHLRLTKLTVETMDDESFLTSDDIDQITTTVDLESIRLGVGFVADNRFFEIIQSAKCANLKVLELHSSCISHGTKLNVGIKMLRLYDDIE